MSPAPSSSRVLARSLAALTVLLLPIAARAQCTQADNLFAEARTCAVRLTWTRLAGTTAPSSWNIFRNSINSIAGATQIGTVAGAVQQFDAPVTSPAAQAFYFVRPVTFGCPNPTSPIISAAAKAQNVSNLQAAPTSCTAVTLSWDAFPDATQYRVQRSTGGFAPVALATLPGTTTSYVDTTGDAGTDYQYTVLVTTACQTSATGSQASTIFPGPPLPGPRLGPVVVTAGTSGAINLGFTNNLALFNPVLRWSKDGEPLTLGGRVTAIDTVLSFDRFKMDDVGFYTLEVTTSCGVASQSVLLAVRPNPCRADFNESGGPPTVQDIFDFLTAWFSGCP